MSTASQRLTLALVHGKIYGGKHFDKVYQAIGMARRRIKLLGENEAVESACDPKTSIIYLNNRVVIPGFIDSHTHFIQMGVNALQLDLGKTRSLQDLLDKVRNRCASIQRGEWVLGSGWDESKWPERRYPLVSDLQLITVSNPIWLRRVDGHLGIANKLALEITQIPVSTRGFEKDYSGKPNGVLREDAMEIMEERLQPDYTMIHKGLKKATERAQLLGVTSIHDMAEPEHIKLYQNLSKKGGLGVRVCVNFFPQSLQEVIGLGQKTGEGDEFLKLGALKLFADGSIGARTAALWKPYADAPGESGILIREQIELTRLVEQADRHGIQLAIHCIGERGIDAALNALEEGCDHTTLAKRRHRLEHFELVEQKSLKRVRRLHLVLSMQPNYVDLWSGRRGLYEGRLGRKRLRINNPFRKLLAAGLPIAFGSDCMPFSPLYGVYSAVNAPLGTQRLSAKEAIGCYTSGSAYASFDEQEKGRIDVGKLADLAILSNNPFEDPGSLSSTKVDMTVFDGKVVFVRSLAKDLRNHLYERRKKKIEKTKEPKITSPKSNPA